MSYIDAMIPGVIGFLLLASTLFAKGGEDNLTEAQRRRQTIGLVLMAVAALYAAMSFANQK